jgi:hypothetical protein
VNDPLLGRSDQPVNESKPEASFLPQSCVTDRMNGVTPRVWFLQRPPRLDPGQASVSFYYCLGQVITESLSLGFFLRHS